MLALRRKIYTMNKNHTQSTTLFERAKQVIPGGVNSPVRAFRGVGGTPRFIQSAKGAYLTDADGNRYIDYVGSWGPMILGHAREEVIAAIQEAASRGTSYGAPTELEIQLAEEVIEAFPSIEKLRLTSSGTEATMSALRVARGFTGRPKIVKFEGCYHGHGDSLLVKAGSGLLTFGNPSSAGVPAAVAADTIVLQYNDPQQLADTFASIGSQIAAIIVEPVAGNMNLVKPTPEFLQAMRSLCDQHGALLIFDEVMTGFRVGLGCAQGLFGIRPDLTTLGKTVGGGMPLAAFGGRADVIDKIAPLGPVYQAGTLSGNPVAVAAGLATLKLLRQPGFYEKLGAATSKMLDGLCQAAAATGQTFTAQSVGGMFGIYFAAQCPQTFIEVMASDKERFNRFFHGMLDEGVYLAPSAYEAGFLSLAHSDADIAETLAAAERCFAQMK